MNLFVTEVISTPNGKWISGSFIVCRNKGTVLIVRYPHPLPLLIALEGLEGYYISCRREPLTDRDVSTGNFIHPEVDFGDREVTDQTLTHLQDTSSATLARHPQCHSSWLDQIQNNWSANEDSQSDISATLSPRADFECAT